MKYYDNSLTNTMFIFQCPSVLDYMTFGKWVPKSNVTNKQRRELDLYLQNLRAEYRIPRNLQRKDNKLVLHFLCLSACISLSLSLTIAHTNIQKH